MTESEIALMDTFKVVFELMLRAGITSVQLDTMLGSLTDQYRAKDMPAASAVTELLRAFVRDPARAEQRDHVQRIQEEPPAGSA